jgi:hypothetical protein
MAGKRSGERMSRQLLQALEMLEAGNWDGAHQIAQEDKTEMGAWLHGIVHILEGDQANAQYWYRRAGRPFPGMDSTKREIVAIRSVLEEKLHA